VRPTGGTATVEGRPYVELPEPARSVGAVLEHSGFHPGRTARNHLRVLATAAGLPASRAEEALGLVGLGEFAKRRVGTYSLGMRQRLALAGALLGEPRALVLDEPANGLDPLGIRWLRDFLRSCADRGCAVLVSSHVLSEIAQLADEVVVIGRGRLLAQAPVTELTARAGGVIEVRTPEADRLAELLRARGAAVEREGDAVLVASGATNEQVGALAAEHGIPIHGMAERGPSLEDVFLELTGRREEEPQ
jgi:ABC-2 type transport system ATP-binding protein